MREADAVRPIGSNAEAHHVGDNQKRGILQYQGVLPELPERDVEIGMLALILPGEVVPLPNVSPTVAPLVFARSALEAVALTGRIGVGGRWLVEHPAQVDEVLLGSRAFLHFGRSPLSDELSWGHGACLVCHQCPCGQIMGRREACEDTLAAYDASSISR